MQGQKNVKFVYFCLMMFNKAKHLEARVVNRSCWFDLKNLPRRGSCKYLRRNEAYAVGRKAVGFVPFVRLFLRSRTAEQTVITIHTGKFYSNLLSTSSFR